MRKFKGYLLALMLTNFFTITALAQSVVSGKVENSLTKEGVSAVSVSVKGASGGTLQR